MDLHGLAGPVVAVVNPWQALKIQRSTGATRNPDGSRTPTYTTWATQGQVQSLTQNDLRQLDALNIQGSQRTVYVACNWDGAERLTGKGGDLLTLPDGTIWLVTAVLEDWPDWCKLSLTLQNGA